MDFNPLAFLELFIVLGFGMAWGVLELVGLRLDKKKAAEKARAAAKAEQAEQAK